MRSERLLLVTHGHCFVETCGVGEDVAQAVTEMALLNTAQEQCDGE
jgi:hypothetical protein